MFSGPAEAGWAPGSGDTLVGFGARRVKADHTQRQPIIETPLTRSNLWVYSEGAYKTSREGEALAPALSVQRWMNCSHLLPSARTRWVTGDCLAEAIKPNERNDRLGSAEQNGFLRQKDGDPI